MNQAALEEVLTAEANGSKDIADFNRKYVGSLEHAAAFSVTQLKKAPGLTIIEPKGAMYMMVQILPECFDESVTDDATFAQMLLEEEAVFVLPGSCFGAPNFFRVVYTAPEAKLRDAYERICEFCARHTSTSSSS